MRPTRFREGANSRVRLAVDQADLLQSFCGRLGRSFRCRFAKLAPAGEAPGVGEGAALGGFGLVDDAVAAVEQGAGAVGFLGEGEAGTRTPQGGAGLDERVLRLAEVGGHGANFGVG